MADSMEMMILSILAPALHCKLCINKYQQAFLTNVRPYRIFEMYGYNF